ncbi:MAG: hypothetical protein RI542_07900 [Wenzhouxiangella sp.]|jgi:hypothetical protein|nr:hypothetical protein [Wenzhouxiangella sp.]
MSDEMLIALWLAWRGFYYWTMVVLLALGAALALACLARIRVPQAKLLKEGWLQAASWVPVFGAGINWGLGKWIGRILFGAH